MGNGSILILSSTQQMESRSCLLGIQTKLAKFCFAGYDAARGKYYSPETSDEWIITISGIRTKFGFYIWPYLIFWVSNKTFQTYTCLSLVNGLQKGTFSLTTTWKPQYEIFSSTIGTHTLFLFHRIGCTIGYVLQ